MLDVLLLFACLVNIAFAGRDRNWAAITGWSVALLGAVKSMIHVC